MAEQAPPAVGLPIERVDGRAKVTGAARYAAEYRLRDLAHGFMVLAATARGRIRELDTAAAEAAPGVIAVFTHRNAPRMAERPFDGGAGRHSAPRPTLQGDRIEFWGQPVALVVAETFEQARRAAGLVRAAYDAEPPTLDFEAGLATAYAPEQINGGLPPDSRVGDLDAGLARAAVRVDATYVTPCEHNSPMEPHATTAAWDGDRLTLFDATQAPSFGAKAVAATLLLPEDKVRVVSRFTGGGFGSKYPPWYNVVLAAMAARELRRPVRVVATRQQTFPTTAHRTRTLQRMRLGAGRDGRLQAIGHDTFVHTATTEQFVEQAGAMTRWMYAAPDRLTTHRVVKLNVPTPSIMRAPGEAPGSFPLESAMDELAWALGMDPVELRIRNEPERDPEKGVPFSSRSLVECYRQGAERFGWAARAPGTRATRDGGWLVGVGCASSTYPTYTRPASARVRLMADGTARAQLAASEIGVGSYTALVQVAADALGLPPERVTVELGDSDLPQTPGSGGSFGLSSAGSALRQACLALKEKMVTARPGQELEASAEFTPDDAQKRFSMHSFGAQFVEVGVDGDTGEVRVRRMLGAFAGGRIVNPRTARSQLLGGMVMGVGMALHEESVIDRRHGQFVNHDLAEYHVPVHADIPATEILLVPEEDQEVNPLGVKGLGELGIVGTAAAVANAVYHATGVRVRELPVTLDKVLAA